MNIPINIPLQALVKGAKHFCNCDSYHPDGNDLGELNSMEKLPVTSLRYGGALSPTSKMLVQLGSLKCFGKNGIYPSEIELEEKRALERRLNVLNETLIEHTKEYQHIPSRLPSGYTKVKSDFGTVVYKLYKERPNRSDALKKCSTDASYLHFPQPTNKQENLFYYDLLYPSLKHSNSYSYGFGAIWLDISKSKSWTN